MCWKMDLKNNHKNWQVKYCEVSVAEAKMACIRESLEMGKGWMGTKELKLSPSKTEALLVGLDARQGAGVLLALFQVGKHFP